MDGLIMENPIKVNALGIGFPIMNRGYGFSTKVNGDTQNSYHIIVKILLNPLGYHPHFVSTLKIHYKLNLPSGEHTNSN